MFFLAHRLSLIYVSQLMNSLSSLLPPYASLRQSPCLSCSVILIPGEDQVLEEGSTHNGCHDDHNKTNSSKVSLLLPEPDLRLLKEERQMFVSFQPLKNDVLCASSYFAIRYWCFISLIFWGDEPVLVVFNRSLHSTQIKEVGLKTHAFKIV